MYKTFEDYFLTFPKIDPDNEEGWQKLIEEIEEEEEKYLFVY